MSDKNIYKWAEISRVTHKLRYDYLSAELTKAGINNEVAYFDFPTDEFDAQIEAIKQDYHQLRIGSPYGEILASTLTQSAFIPFSLNSCDVLMRQDGEWWPRSFLESTFVEAIIKSFTTLNIEDHAIIVGSGTAARAVFSALLKVGYSKFLFAEYFEERATQTLRDLKARYFNINIRYISQDELAYLPGICSIIVNTTPNTEDNALLKDLFYFNYLNKSAVVVDTNHEPLDPPLIQQAKDLNLRVCDGLYICASVDIAWAKSCFGVQLDLNTYIDGWRKFIASSTTQT